MAVMRRVNIRGSLSEQGLVKALYETYIEEHLGASNRNLFRE